MRLVDRLRRYVASTGNRIGYVKFIKKNGELREMWFKSKIPKSKLAGGELKYDPVEKGLAIVYDIAIKEIRAINLKTVISLSACGRRYKHG